MLSFDAVLFSSSEINESADSFASLAILFSFARVVLRFLTCVNNTFRLQIINTATDR